MCFQTCHAPQAGGVAVQSILKKSALVLQAGPLHRPHPQTFSCYIFPKQCLTAVVSSFDTSLPHPCPLLNLPAWKDKRWLGEILLRPCSGVHSAGWKYEFVSGQQRCLTVHALARYYFESNQGLLLDVP